MLIRIEGARENNLKNIDVEIGNGLTAVTGVSAPEAEPWIALEIRTALRDIESGGTWIGGQPSTPFSPYPRQRRRY
jgi:hypothetical protein